MCIEYLFPLAQAHARVEAGFDDEINTLGYFRAVLMSMRNEKIRTKRTMYNCDEIYGTSLASRPPLSTISTLTMVGDKKIESCAHSPESNYSPAPWIST